MQTPTRRRLSAPGYYMARLETLRRAKPYTVYQGPHYLERTLDDAEREAHLTGRRVEVLAQFGLGGAEVIAVAVPALCGDCDGTPHNRIAARR